MTKRNSWDPYSDPSVVRVSSFGQLKTFCNRADELYLYEQRSVLLGFTCPEAGGKPSLIAPHTAVPWF